MTKKLPHVNLDQHPAGAPVADVGQLPSFNLAASKLPAFNLDSKPAGGVAVKPKKKHGGLLHTLEQGAADLRDVALHSPTGVFDLGKAVVNPVVQDIKHGPSSQQAKKARAQLDEIGKQSVKQPIEDLHHPL